MAENIDLNDMNRVDDFEEERAVEEETSFIEDNPRDQSMIIIDPSVPNVRRDVGVFRRAYTQDKKYFLRKELGVNINKGDGPNSSIVIDKMELTLTKDRTKVNGVRCNGVKVTVLKDGKMEFSTDKTKERVVNEFGELMRKAEAEHSATSVGYLEKRLANELNVEKHDIIDDELTDDVVARSIEKIEQQISDVEDEIVAGLTENGLHEF